MSLWPSSSGGTASKHGLRIQRKKKLLSALAKPDGGYVRTHVDGTTELPTTERGGLRRYVIRRDGTAALIEAGAESGHHQLSQRLLMAGPLLCMATGALVLVGTALGAIIGRRLEFVAAAALVIFALGVALWVVGLAFAPSAQPPPGERWKRIGFPEH